MSESIAVAARVRSTAEAQLIVGLLQSNGVAAMVAPDDAAGLEPQLQFTHGVRVLVAARNEVRARRLIAEATARERR